MAWALVDDKYFSNPKITSLPVPVSYMYLASLAFANGYMTDGIITPPGLLIIATQAKIKNAKAAAESLVEAGLWEAVGEGWFIHDYFEYNKSKAFILTEREKKAAAGSKGGKASATANAKAGAIASAKARAKNSLDQNASNCPAISPSPSPKDINSPLPPLPPQDFQLFADVYESITGVEPKVLNAEIEAVQAILEAGGTPDDYRKALQGMQDKDYTISSMASALKWTLADIEKRKRPTRINNSRKPKGPDMGGYEVDRTSEVVIIDNGEAFDGELQF